MKINCGPTADERRQARAIRFEKERAKLEQWRRVFAWWPKRMGPKDCRWLEFIERKGEYHTPMDHLNDEVWFYFTPYWTWEYRPCDRR